MLMTELLIAGIQHQLHHRIEWLRSLFSLMEPVDTTPYPYHVVQRLDGIYYADPNNPEQYLKADTKPGIDGLLTPATVINLKPNDLPNVTKPITTVVGNVLINAIMLCYPFGKKIPYLEGSVSGSKIEALVLPLLTDDPKPNETPKDDLIYVSEYVKLTEASNYLLELCDIFTPAASAKQLVPPPGIVAYREKLLKENKDRLTDPAVLAKIDKELVEYDTKFLADDEEAQAFLTKKYRNESRRKMFLTVGSQSGFKNGVEVENIPRSLNEKPTVESMAASRSAARLGSFNRGYETMKGGATFKELLRAASNAKIVDKDCGTKLGVTEYLTEDNYRDYLGFYFQTTKGPVLLTDANYKEFTNKYTTRRSSQFCATAETDYCPICAGRRLVLHPTGISVAVSDIGSIFLNLSLKKMHVSGRSTVKLELAEAII